MSPRRSITLRLHDYIRSWLRPARGLANRDRLHAHLKLEHLEDRTMPALTIGATAPTTGLPRTDISYIATIGNSGSSALSSVEMDDTVPSYMTFLSQKQVSGPTFTLSNSGASISDTISSLAAGATATIDVFVSINASVPNNTLIFNPFSAHYGMSPPTTAAALINIYTYDPISLTNPGTQSSTEGGTVSLSLSASDATSGTLTYGAAGLPAGLQINSSTGAITGTVALGAAVSGPYQTLVTVTDGTYTNSTQFTWNVSSPVALTNPGTQTNTEGDTVSLSLSATDSTSGTLSYSAVGLPTGLKINTGTGAITGTVAPGTAANGPYSVTITAIDGTYSDSQTFTWTVN